MVAFERPVGAAADTSELQYVAAIHQTGKEMRPDGSIRDEDIMIYLKSRFGIEVSQEDVRKTILQGMGGSDGEDEVVDLIELVAIIMIPLLLKASMVEEGKALPEGVLPPPPGLLESVSKVMLHDSTGDHDGHLLTPDLVKKIFRCYGEHEMANNDELVEEMIQAAGGSGIPLDASAFARALTNDVKLYDLKWETTKSTVLQDVFGDEDHNEAKKSETDADPEGKHSVPIEDIKRVYTAPSIDITAGTYRSESLFVMVWMSVLFGVFTVVLFTPTPNSCADAGLTWNAQGTFAENNAVMICEMIVSIVSWLINFFTFCLLGLGFIWLGSLGNFVGNKKFYLPFIGALVVFLFGFWEVVVVRPRPDHEPAIHLIFVAKMISALLAVYLHFSHIYSICSRGDEDKGVSKLAKLFRHSALDSEKHVKSAAAYKLNSLAGNACKVMSQESNCTVFKTYFGHGLSAYANHGTQYETCGGFFWLVRKILDKTIYSEEGVWYSTRLLAGNMAQFIIALFILLFGINMAQYINNNFTQNDVRDRLVTTVNNFFDQADPVIYDATSQISSYVSTFILQANSSEFIDFGCSQLGSSGYDLIVEICPNLADESIAYMPFDCNTNSSPVDAICALLQVPDLNPYLQMDLLAVAGLDVEQVLALLRGQAQAVVDQGVDNLYPESLYMLIVPMWVFTAVGTITALYLTLTYLSSVTTTIIQLRTGVIPTLKADDFEKYRVSQDTVTLLTGSMFWGTLVSSLLFGVLVAIIVFFGLWQASVYLVQKLITLAVGFGVVILFRMLMISCCKSWYFQGLYRKKPAAANIAMMALEWANYIFSTLVILIRMVKLIVVAVAYIGKIDRPLLAKGVGQIASVELDPYPTIHTRDLLAHDAHRHPYIEVLGTMYLMKLRYAKSFGNRAGSSWRLIFVFALLPWLHQYRLYDDDDDQVIEFSKASDTRGSSLSLVLQKDELKKERSFVLTDPDRLESYEVVISQLRAEMEELTKKLEAAENK